MVFVDNTRISSIIPPAMDILINLIAEALETECDMREEKTDVAMRVNYIK